MARAEDLARQLLAFSRGQPLSPEQVELNVLTRIAGELFRHLLGAEVELRTALDPKVEQIMIDATQLEVALLTSAVICRDAMEGHGDIDDRDCGSGRRSRPICTGVSPRHRLRNGC